MKIEYFIVLYIKILSIMNSFIIIFSRTSDKPKVLKSLIKRIL